MNFLKLACFAFCFLFLSPAFSGADAAGAVSSDAAASDGGGLAGKGPKADGYTGNGEAAVAVVEKMKAIPPKYPGVVITMPDLAPLATSVGTFSKYHGICAKSQATASWVCREETSPKLAETVAMINTGFSTITAVAVKDTCSNVAKILDLAKAGMTAYTTICGGARASCEVTCSSSLDGLTKAQQTLKRMPGSWSCIPSNPVMGAQCNIAQQEYMASIQELEGLLAKDAPPADGRAIAGKSRACTYNYGQLVASGIAGIASLIQSFNSAKECEKDSDGAETPPVASLQEKCANSANAQLPECICIADPRTAGCSNTLEKAGLSAGDIASLTLNPSTPSDRSTASVADLGLGGSDLDPNLPPAEGSDSGGLPGAPTGGGGAGLGSSGGGFGGGPNTGDGKSAKGLNTNILSGTGGGGGGGFGSWGGGSGNSNSRLRSYLPGGAKDPNKGMAGQQNWSKEVTGQGGKSNFEKVKDRYRDNKNTLLNN